MTFIKLNKLKASSLEADAGVANGTFNNYSKRNADLPNEAIDNLSKKWGEEMRLAGFHIINTNPFGGQQLAIINDAEMKELIVKRNAFVHTSGSPVPEDYKAAFFSVLERERKALEDDKAFFKGLLKSNLELLSGRQLTIQAEIQAIHQWDAQIVSGGDKAKEESALNHILSLVVHNRERLLKESIEPEKGR